MEIYTIRDIARKAGVGVSTVSRVLNGRPDVSETTRKRVTEVVEACGFVQNRNARNLKTTKPVFAAIIVRGRRNMFLSDMAEEMLHCAQGYKTPFIVKYIDEEDDEFGAMRQLWNEKRAGGFILLGSRIDERSEIVASLGMPCVFATVDAAGSGIANASSVCIDDRAAAREVMDRLLANGHTNVAVFGGNSEGNDVFARRYQGAMDSLRAHGVDFNPEHYVVTRFTLTGAYESARRFFEGHREITAVLAMSDTVAAGVIRALWELGLRVPQDVSVTGYDGTEMAKYFIPAIDTVRQPTKEIARESVKLLCEMLEGGERRDVTVAYEYVPGESVAACRSCAREG
ncbi:MAG: LacI family DNA-binding transcriptional regulator [Clostridia bacterium]|nr:LacI family DNA-binding transcriptional regulator [Clostridia bacterium]